MRSPSLKQLRIDIRRAVKAGQDALTSIQRSPFLEKAAEESGVGVEQIERLMVRYALRLALNEFEDDEDAHAPEWTADALHFGYATPTLLWSASNGDLKKRIHLAISEGHFDIDADFERALLVTQGQNRNPAPVTAAVVDDGIHVRALGYDAERISPGDTDLNMSHGTQVASTLVSGQLKVRLLDVPIYDGDNDDAVEPSRLCEQLKKALSSGAQVLNISSTFEAEYAEPISDVIAENPHALFVFAAGNKPLTLDDATAAHVLNGRLLQEVERRNLRNVVVVGAHDAAGELSDFSATGQHVDVATWGEAVFVQDKNARTGVARADGTSLAAPRVSRLAVQMLQVLGPAASNFQGGTGAGVASLLQLACPAFSKRPEDNAQLPRLDARLALKLAVYFRLSTTGREGQPPMSQEDALRWVSLSTEKAHAVEALRG